MFFAGLGTASPPYRYTQTECLDALSASTPYQGLSRASHVLLKRILGSEHGIGYRHLALPKLAGAFDLTPDTLHARFVEAAPQLAQEAARKALAAAGMEAGDMDAVLISTCTGYLCPGLTSYVTQGLGLRSDVLALDLVGQGCGAALPNLRTAKALIDGASARRVLSICVEVCSAALYLDDDPGVLVSTCLFSDGAGAAVLTHEHRGDGQAVEWLDADTLIDVHERDQLRFQHTRGMLKNVLSPRVPQLAAGYAKQVLERVLARHELNRSDITEWVFHGGGKNVLDALQQQLPLTADAVAVSREVLHDHGNMSSAFIYFVLQRALARAPQPGAWWVSSFGAGFSCHGALLRVS